MILLQAYEIQKWLGEQEIPATFSASIFFALFKVGCLKGKKAAFLFPKSSPRCRPMVSLPSPSSSLRLARSPTKTTPAIWKRLRSVRPIRAYYIPTFSSVGPAPGSPSKR
ncbi:hypothetical protein B0H67DRAFT_582565 [Lasiosphaeris hirsuta]|uniref:Uncharacterized protein n=1 Tax=Lasiosphaeris hirsuta TaxID=260670 RepID=A0AA40AHZ9_9PEZI|nr:hypothetical protein B0H67DRAFT_582565 [Lasiosphaeris hirsuta]